MSLYQHSKDGKVRRTTKQEEWFQMALKVRFPPPPHFFPWPSPTELCVTPIERPQVMADLYASAVGTTVLQLEEIPQRPTDFNGAVCLFNVVPPCTDATVRSAMGHFGTILAVDLERDPIVVRFQSHDAACKAAKAAKEGMPSFCDGVSMTYNERSYRGREGESGQGGDNGRGWCARALDHGLTSLLSSQHTPYIWHRLRVKMAGAAWRMG